MRVRKISDQKVVSFFVEGGPPPLKLTRERDVSKVLGVELNSRGCVIDKVKRRKIQV